MNRNLLFFLCLLLSLPLSLVAQDEDEKTPGLSSRTLSAMSFRNVGPALTSGRIIDLAVNPENHAEYYVAVASGGVWKTINAGTTYEPIFDGQSSYSIGCITLDPNNPNVVWVGTGENNGQRSVGYGDGVYKSTDGGRSWKNMGLKTSEHIGNIVIDPTDSDVIYVAAQGPLWNEGGERGLYKSTDGGETWTEMMGDLIDEHTGVNEVHMDPRNPDVLYASTWQRRRKVWTQIMGGPGSGLYKSTDGGESWEKIQSGLPGGDLGRIGLDISPADPDVVYAIVEASGDKGGFYRSTNRGASWQRMSGMSTIGLYYQEIFADPHDVDRVYVMDTYAHKTEDGGRNFSRINSRHKHVDNHALWIDPSTPDHYLMGCDGGLYETWDNAATWHYKPNLPIIQFYKVVVDNSEPFYNIYGGTQDNNSMGGPSQTINEHGIANEDWFITNGGDGFESAVDPDNPNIIYAQAQYGWLVRYDKQSGESIFIQPQPDKDEPALRWNWDAPLLISPHQGSRVFFAANKLFMSDDRGDTWQAISPDLSRQLDRNAIPVMGRVWSMDAVAKNKSTSIYGNIVALDESPVTQGLLYAGTDDGLIHTSTDLGENWTTVKSEDLPGIDERVYVNMLLASQHDDQVVYAALNNHKNGGFAPYLFKSTDQGKSWTAIQSDLPERGSVYCIAEDHENPNLLFAGTEFGAFVSTNGGENWHQLKSGLPTIAIRDMAIQKRENDLVLASFGRGFYVLDDYSPLRELAEKEEEILASEAYVFPTSDALLYLEASPYGGGSKGDQGNSFWAAENPDVAATFTYYLKESLQTLEQIRKKEEGKLWKEGEDVPYPSADEIRAEDDETAPYLLFTITDSRGEVVTRIKGSARAGMNQVTWNLRYPSVFPVSGRTRQNGENRGFLAIPGTYYVAMGKVVDEVYTELVPKQPFNVRPLDNVTLPVEDVDELLAFQEKVAELSRSIAAAAAIHSDLEERMDALKTAIRQTPAAPIDMMAQVRAIEKRLTDMDRELNGDRSLSSREFETVPGIRSRAQSIIWGLSGSRSAPTTTMERNYEIAAEAFEPFYENLKEIVEEVQEIESKLEGMGAPYTSGRALNWMRE